MDQASLVRRAEAGGVDARSIIAEITEKRSSRAFSLVSFTTILRWFCTVLTCFVLVSTATFREVLLRRAVDDPGAVAGVRGEAAARAAERAGIAERLITLAPRG